MQSPPREQGAKQIGGLLDEYADTTSPPAVTTHTRVGRKTGRVQSRERIMLAEEIQVARWWKNRKGDAIALRLKSYEGCNLVDLRTFFVGKSGQLLPAKGFAAAVNHLPRLAKEFARARDKAIELGLIEPEAE